MIHMMMYILSVFLYNKFLYLFSLTIEMKKGKDVQLFFRFPLLPKIWSFFKLLFVSERECKVIRRLIVLCSVLECIRFFYSIPSG